MKLSERIQKILDETGADQVQLGQAAGVTKGTVNQWLSADIKSIKLEYAVGIQERYGYNPVWIVLGKGDRKGEASGIEASPSASLYAGLSLAAADLVAEVRAAEKRGISAAALTAITSLLKEMRGHGDAPTQDDRTHVIGND